MANKRCRLHGGLTPKGAGNPNYKHGRYSKYLPQGLADRYLAAANDPDLLSLSGEISLTQTLIEDKLERIYAGETEGRWSSIWNYLDEFDKVWNDPDPDDPDKAARLFRLLKNLIRSGRSTFDTFREIAALVEGKRRLTETENKRKEKLDNNLSPDAAIAFVRAVGEAVNRHVHDPNVRQRIHEDLARVVRGRAA